MFSNYRHVRLQKEGVKLTQILFYWTATWHVESAFLWTIVYRRTTTVDYSPIHAIKMLIPRHYIASLNWKEKYKFLKKKIKIFGQNAQCRMNWKKMILSLNSTLDFQITIHWKFEFLKTVLEHKINWRGSGMLDKDDVTQRKKGDRVSYHLRKIFCGHDSPKTWTYLDRPSNKIWSQWKWCKQHIYHMDQFDVLWVKIPASKGRIGRWGES